MLTTELGCTAKGLFAYLKDYSSLLLISNKIVEYTPDNTNRLQQLLQQLHLGITIAKLCQFHDLGMRVKSR